MKQIVFNYILKNARLKNDLLFSIWFEPFKNHLYQLNYAQVEYSATNLYFYEQECVIFDTN